MKKRLLKKKFKEVLRLVIAVAGNGEAADILRRLAKDRGLDLKEKRKARREYELEERAGG
jgi:hypothetical protein